MSGNALPARELHLLSWPHQPKAGEIICSVLTDVTLPAVRLAKVLDRLGHKKSPGRTGAELQAPGDLRTLLAPSGRGCRTRYADFRATIGEGRGAGPGSGRSTYGGSAGESGSVVKIYSASFSYPTATSSIVARASGFLWSLRLGQATGSTEALLWRLTNGRPEVATPVLCQPGSSK